jgi:serine/threonine protein kinase
LCLSKDIKDIDVVRNKFFKEAEKIRSFSDCENIIKVFDVFDENNTSYYTMEYIDGDNLHDYVERHGPFGEKEAIRIIKGVANALKRIHYDRILHMDVKPKNIMISKEGRVVLIDFGGAHKYNISPQYNTTLAGIASPGFTPPELASSVRFSPPYDIYSLGATLYYMLTKSFYSHYSEDSTRKCENGKHHMQCSWASGVSEETNRCIEKSLSYLPKDRPQSIDEFLAMLPS